MSRTLVPTGVAEADDLVALVTDDTAVGEIGAAYLAAYPNEANEAVLVDAIAPPGSTLATASATDRPEVLRTIVREDFASAATITLDGWLLSSTGARLCALAHLTG